jgi:hypothetical protein
LMISASPVIMRFLAKGASHVGQEIAPSGSPGLGCVN